MDYNVSFMNLVPQVDNLIHLKEYSPILLVGCVYNHISYFVLSNLGCDIVFFVKL